MVLVRVTYLMATYTITAIHNSVCSSILRHFAVLWCMESPWFSLSNVAGIRVYVSHLLFSAFDSRKKHPGLFLERGLALFCLVSVFRGIYLCSVAKGRAWFESKSFCAGKQSKFDTLQESCSQHLPLINEYSGIKSVNLCVFHNSTSIRA